jgi:hypothetical protein
MVWSDGVVLEAGTTFPATLQHLISRPTHYHDIRSFINKVKAVSATGGWSKASVLRSARGDERSAIRSADGRITASVNSLYVDYLNERYPTATVRIRSDTDPILFEVDGEIRAMLMPIKL